MTVFATLTPDQIDLDRTSAEGVSALKAFLEYAQKQTLPQNENTFRSEITKTEGIAASICEYLKEQGFETQRNVGHSEYKLDIGVIDPQKPDQYKLGIMLDGRTYGTAKTVRDREIAQIGVLNGLGWRIHRVWTMDWWDNTQKELDRILEILNEPTPEPEVVEETPVQEAPAQTPQKLAESTPSKKKAAPAVPYYAPAKLRESVVTAEDLLLPKYAAGLRKKLETVVAKEAPIAKALLLRRVVQSYGITRAGSRITAYLEKMIEGMNLQSHQQEDMTFYWAPGQDPESYFTYRPAPSEEDRRDPKEIPVQEAAGAVCQVLEDQISLNQDDLIRESAKLLGYTRLGTSVTYLFSNAIRYAVWKNKITQGANGNWTITKQLP
jgi:very-short-patch-repair endonuclease